MNLNKITNINKDIDFSPIVITNNLKIKISRYNNLLKKSEKTYSKHEIDKAVLDGDETHRILNPLITERFGKLFTTELETSLNNSRTVANEYTPKQTLEKNKLFDEAKNLCTELYNPKKQSRKIIDRRIKLYENMQKGINPLLKDLQENALSPKIISNDKGVRKKLLTNINFKKINLRSQSIDKNSDYIRNFIKHYYDEFKPENRNCKKFSYQNYAIKYKIYKHNQMYVLNKIKLPPLRGANSNRNSKIKDFSGLIPERSKDTKKSKKEDYCMYKVMENNKKDNFLI